MGIELPAELADVAAATGVSWPQADEDAMREQAGAWRQAAQELTTLAAEADTVAGKALGAMSGDAGEAARQKWSGFVDPDGGRLTTAAQGAQQAADRLDRAAEQVAAAKVEIVRNLVDAARNRDAAMVAAESGHPAALAGLDTVLRGTATNVGAVTSGLVGAVGSGADGPAQPVGDVVNAHPGAHTADGQSGLLSTVTGLPRSVVEDALAGAEAVPDALAGLDKPGGVGLPEHLGGPGLPEQLGGGSGLSLPEGRPEPGPLFGLPEHLRDHPAADLPGRDVPGSDLPAPDVRVPDLPGTGPGDEGTGPIALPDAPTPPSGIAGLPGGFADAPTPPSGTAFPPAASGQTHLAGYSGGPAVAPAAQPMQQPVQPMPQQQFGGQGYAPPFGQPFAGQPGPAPIAPGPQQPPAPPGQHPAAPPPVVRNAPPAPPGQQPSGPPLAAPGAPRNAPPPMAPPPVLPAHPPGGLRNVPWGPSAEPPYPPHRPPEPVRAQPPAPPVPVGAPRQERESIVALFLVHMFPIGHLPVASDRPARQLPVPGGDDATRVRHGCFPPHDHPRSSVVDSGQALAWLRQGWRQPAPPPAEVLPCPPDALREGYDPLGGLHERDWDSRYLADDGERPEYVWPPGDRYPEGGTAGGEPELVAEGTLLDRFGTAHGRVFAPAGTPFAQRSLPPSHLEAGYRRYRVVREVPMWRTVSAGWFGQPGGGVRYRAVYSAAELVHLGYLADITFEEVA